ncbi:MAG: MBL fold metallo-hydrolase [Proteobacteria bacterium]|nr:MBL fold metallo-hydrolase [Pseudomonadota bacterium]
MFIKCWGARGSIPVSGSEFLKYGGNTTCIEIRTKNNEVIIIDAGSGIRNLGSSLIKEGKKKVNIVFTHYHWDHLLGFPFFKPVYFSGHSINLYGRTFCEKSVVEMLMPSMRPPYFPVRFEDALADIHSNEIADSPFVIDSVTIEPIILSHPNKGLGYRFTEDGKSFVFLTDNELSYKHEGGLDFADYAAFAEGADLLVHDAEYTETDYEMTRMWGHTVYKDALRLAMEAGVKRFALYHHNQERSDQAVDALVDDCKSIIAKNSSSLDCFAMYEGQEITL